VAVNQPARRARAHQNRMTTRLTFTDFAARLKEFIRRAAPTPCGRAELRGKTLETRFNELAVELFRLQFAHVPAYRHLCKARGVTPTSVERWKQIPAVPTTAFKELDLTSLAPHERETVFYSSGTTGQQPSRHFHNAESLAWYEASVLPWFRDHLLRRFPLEEWPKPYSPGGPRCVMLTPLPAQARHSSLVHMFNTVQRHYGCPRSAFVGRATDDGWNLDLGKLRRHFDEGPPAAQPVLLLGTAFSLVELLDRLAHEGLRYALPAGSRILETGGYKGRSREVPRTELYHSMYDRLGVAPEFIVSEYGMSELSSQAYDHIAGAPLPADAPPEGADAARVFRFPPWARAQVISAETGKEVAEGETGLLRVFDLANVRSVMAIQTEDLAVRRGDGFQLLGRAPRVEARGCSLLAAA
jgi:hypothetical protein